MADESNDQTYSIKEPFDIDNGDLAGVDSVTAFALGVEWQMISAELESGDRIERPLHSENESRVKRMCIRRGRKVRIMDNGPGWKWLMVD